MLDTATNSFITLQEAIMARTLKDAEEEILELKATIKELSLDDLTGLPLRKSFQSAVEREILRCKRTKKSFSIFHIDVNDFKAVNDTHGHPIGDQLLVSIALCISGALRNCDMVARTGGDEFMVFTPDQSESGARAVKNHLLQKFTEGMREWPFFRGVAIGSATFGKDGTCFQELYDRADIAMYAHKKDMKKRA